MNKHLDFLGGYPFPGVNMSKESSFELDNISVLEAVLHYSCCLTGMEAPCWEGFNLFGEAGHFLLL